MNFGVSFMLNIPYSEFRFGQVLSRVSDWVAVRNNVSERRSSARRALR